MPIFRSPVHSPHVVLWLEADKLTVPCERFLLPQTVISVAVVVVIAIIIVIVVGSYRRIDDGHKEQEPTVLITRAPRPARNRMAGLAAFGFLWQRAAQTDLRDAIPEGTTLILKDDQVSPERRVFQPRLGLILICRVKNDDPSS